MPRMRKAALAILAVVVMTSSLPVGVARAAEALSPAAIGAATPAQPRTSVVQAVPAGKSAPARVRPAAASEEPSSLAQTAGAFAGGLLMVVLAAFGLTITFRSLVKDMKGRKRRYRRRARRTEPGSAQA